MVLALVWCFWSEKSFFVVMLDVPSNLKFWRNSIPNLRIGYSKTQGILQNEHFFPWNNNNHLESIPRNFFRNWILITSLVKNDKNKSQTAYSYLSNAWGKGNFFFYLKNFSQKTYDYYFVKFPTIFLDLGAR